MRALRRHATVLVVAGGLLISASPAGAIKWKHCPGQAGAYASELGAVSAPFIHPGHDIALYLSEREAATTGGFPVGADSTITVTFASLFGDPVVLPSFTAQAVTETTLFFSFPDAQSVLGRPLAGPVDVLVQNGDVTTAHITADDLVALPPAVDVSGTSSSTATKNAYATIDSHGDLWMPVSFSAYGPMPKPMPMCPGVFVPITAVNVGITVRSLPSSVGGSVPTYPYLRALKRVDLFMGDFVVNGYNAYGSHVGRLPVFRIARGWGIRVCGLNDAAEFVMKARGFRRWARPWSPFAGQMPNSAPLAIDFRDFTADPTVSIRPGGLDAFGTECTLE